MTNKKIEIEIVKPLRGYPAGYKLKILTDKNGTPFDKYWRDRLRDAKIDNCIKVIKKKRSTEG